MVWMVVVWGCAARAPIDAALEGPKAVWTEGEYTVELHGLSDGRTLTKQGLTALVGVLDTFEEDGRPGGPKTQDDVRQAPHLDVRKGTRRWLVTGGWTTPVVRGVPEAGESRRDFVCYLPEPEAVCTLLDMREDFWLPMYLSEDRDTVIKKPEEWSVKGMASKGRVRAFLGDSLILDEESSPTGMTSRSVPLKLDPGEYTVRFEGVVGEGGELEFGLKQWGDESQSWSQRFTEDTTLSRTFTQSPGVEEGYLVSASEAVPWEVPEGAVLAPELKLLRQDGTIPIYTLHSSNMRVVVKLNGHEFTRDVEDSGASASLQLPLFFDLKNGENTVEVEMKPLGENARAELTIADRQGFDAVNTYVAMTYDPATPVQSATFEFPSHAELPWYSAEPVTLDATQRQKVDALVTQLHGILAASDGDAFARVYATALRDIAVVSPEFRSQAWIDTHVVNHLSKTHTLAPLPSLDGAYRLGGGGQKLQLLDKAGIPLLSAESEEGTLYFAPWVAFFDGEPVIISKY